MQRLTFKEKQRTFTAENQNSVTHFNHTLLRTHPFISRLISGILSVFLILEPSALQLGSGFAYADNEPVVFFGPQKYLRTKGAKDEYTNTIILNAEAGESTLHLENGESNGNNRVSSAWIYLNGSLIADPDDFGQEVSTFYAPVSLTLQNEIKVILASKPGSYFHITLLGVPVQTDVTPPAIIANISPAANLNGWNNSDVTVTFSGTDSESGLASITSPITVTTEGENQIVTGTATDNAGNVATLEVTLNIDKTPPQIDASTQPQPNASGWNNSDVTVEFTGNDIGSGIATLSDPVTITTEGENQTVTGTATDFADNTATVSVNLNIDKTPPQIQSQTSPLPNTAGWNNSDTTVSFTGSDSISGLSFISSPVTVTSEGTAQVVTGTATDNADNTATLDVTINIDKTVPEIDAILTPAPNTAGWNNSDVTVNFTGTDSLSGLSSVSSPVTLSSEGQNQTLTGTAEDQAGNTNSLEVSVNIDKTPPILSFTPPPAPGETVLTTPFTFQGEADDSLSGLYSVTLNASPVNLNGTNWESALDLTEGENLLQAQATDNADNQTQSYLNVIHSSAGPIPPDPADVAPPHDPTVPTTIFNSTSFLFTGENPIQSGVAEDTIHPAHVSIIRGKILKRDGTPLIGVKVLIKGHPEYGETLSRLDGWFDMAVNGGTTYTLEFTKQDYLTIQRQTEPDWQEYTELPDITMIQVDPVSTTVTLDGTQTVIQIAQGSPVQDIDGTRQATILFPAGTTAQMKMPDGSLLPLPSLTVRATEYTVGENGPNAMPGPLPAGSGYTYCVELSVDEAMNAGAVEVQFNTPVPFYVDNFLGFPVGENVPTGYFNRVKSAWIPSENGRIIQILSITDNKADIDTDGDGNVDNSLGLSDAEREALATLYSPGKSLWRVPTPHFTPWDHNWPYGPPLNAINAAIAGVEKIIGGISGMPDKNNTTCGSVIEVENQTLGEDLSLPGTPFGLHYRTNRMPGYKSVLNVHIPLTTNSPPENLKRITLDIEIAGKTTHQEFIPAPDLFFDFTWDGKDVYDREIYGLQTANIRIGYVYTVIYQDSADFTYSFSRLSGIPIQQSVSNREVVLYSDQKINLMHNTPLSSPFGGWTLSAHHKYNTQYQVIYFGDGNQRSTDNLGHSIITVAGTGANGFSGDGSPAISATFRNPSSVSISADGSIYIADTGNLRIRRVGTNGIISTIAGKGNIGTFQGLNGPATNATLLGPSNVVAAPDGSIYFTDVHRVLKIDTNGFLRLVAGTGLNSFGGDGGFATQAYLSLPSGIALAPDNSLYIVDSGNGRLRKVGTDGKINTIAGTGATNSTGDGGPAIQASLGGPKGVCIAPDGSVYVTSFFNRRVRRIGTDGIIKTVAGNGNLGFTGDGASALSASFWGLNGIAVSSKGDIYIADYTNSIANPPQSFPIRAIDTFGTITTIAGAGLDNYNDKGPASSARLINPSSINIAPDGSFYITDSNRVRHITLPLPGFSFNEVVVPSESGEEVFIFDPTGKHLRTLNSRTQALIYQFAYDSENKLTSVIDGDGNETTFTYAPSQITVTGQDGMQTILELNSAGYLSSIISPENQTTTLTYTPDGLLTQMTDPNQHPTVFEYDAEGRLFKDTNAAGGFKQLTRNEISPDKYEIIQTTAEGKTSTFGMEYLPNGQIKRTTSLCPCTGDKVVLIGTDQTVTTTNIDGTVSVLKQGPDPRFGMQTPIPVSSTVTTPGGKVLTQTMTRQVTLTDPSNPLTLATLTDSVTVNGKTSQSVFNASANTLTTTSPEGRTSLTFFDNQGRILRSEIPGLAPVEYNYDSKGRLVTITEDDGNTQRISTNAYNPVTGFLESTTDPLNQQTSFQYDGLGRPLSQTLPDLRNISFSYDQSNNVTGITPPGKPEHTFSFNSIDLEEAYTPPAIGLPEHRTQYDYNLDQEMTTLTRPDGAMLSFDYNIRGQISQIVTPTRTFDFSYYLPQGTLESITTTDGESLTFAYDGSLPLSSTWAGTFNGSVSQTYDNDFRVVSQSVNGANSIAFGYDNDSLLTSAGALTITHSPLNGLITGTSLGSVSDTRTYNAFGEADSYVAQYGASNVATFNYTRDKLGRITQKTETISGMTNTFDYTYDVTGRLTDVSKNSAPISHYEFDDNGNRTLHNTTAGTYDDQDRLLSYGDYTYTYTANGELLSKTNAQNNETTSYVYDTLGNLLSVTLPDNTFIEYVIDAQNRRIGKKVNGTLVKGWLYQDGLNPVAELDGSGNIVSRFVYGSWPYCPDYMIKNGETYRIIQDHLGSPKVVINANTGSIAQQLDFDEFGNVLSDSNPTFQPFGFAGGLYDPQTGLVRFGARDYDSYTGRWTCKDPIRFEGGDTSLYTYCNNDPENRIDPEGLFAVWDVADAYFFYDSLKSYKKCKNFDTGLDLAINTISLLPIIPSLGTIKKVTNKSAKAAAKYLFRKEAAGLELKIIRSGRDGTGKIVGIGTKGRGGPSYRPKPDGSYSVGKAGDIKHIRPTPGGGYTIN